MNYTKIDIRTWSILGSRGTFGVALTQLAAEDPRIVALSADLCNTSGLDRFRAAYPTRFTNIGIAEQNMLGVAAGLAASGFVPFATTFANFAALRACEQVRHYLGYMQENVKLVGFGGGFAMGMFGVTHFAIEDIAALRTISNLTILCPCDGLQVVKATRAAAALTGPVYLRLTGVMNAPVVYKEDCDYQVGKAIQLVDGDSVAIIATGSTVHAALKAAEILSAAGISTRVLDMHTIKPIDQAALPALRQFRLVVTVEEHSTTGGLGSAVAECGSEIAGFPKVLRIGVTQGYPHVGDYAYMINHYGLTADKIAARVQDVLKREEVFA